MPLVPRVGKLEFPEIRGPLQLLSWLFRVTRLYPSTFQDIDIYGAHPYEETCLGKP